MSDEEERRLGREWERTRDPEAGARYYDVVARRRPRGCPVCGHEETVEGVERVMADRVGNAHPSAETPAERVTCAGCGVSYVSEAALLVAAALRRIAAGVHAAVLTPSERWAAGRRIQERQERAERERRAEWEALTAAAARVHAEREHTLREIALANRAEADHWEREARAAGVHVEDPTEVSGDVVTVGDYGAGLGEDSEEDSVEEDTWDGAGR